MNKVNIKKVITYLLILAVGLLLGRFLFHSHDEKSTGTTKVSESEEHTIWTCSMHPHIRMDKPGDCPICGMDLIPLNQMTADSASMDPMAIHLTPEAAQLANVETSVVSKQKPVKEVRLFGKIQADERLLQSLTAHIPGRIEKLLVNFTGDYIRQGQQIAEIYSPELLVAQQELLEAAKVKDIQPQIFEASRERLMHWKLTENQIENIISSGKVKSTFPIYATISGVVTAKRINQGDHVTEGTILYDIADLSTVWAMFDAYESDLPFLNEGDKITFSAQAVPNVEYSGKIQFIDPVIDPTTRVSKVRLQVNNSNGKLKPEMFITGILKADLEQYTNNLVIPRSAVLWTGKRSIVYVKIPGSEHPVFKMREIEIGPSLGNGYIVLSGLSEGEEIVTSGTFNVDAAAQLEGKPSMMNPVGGSNSTGHDHGAMPELNKPQNEKNTVLEDHSNHKQQKVTTQRSESMKSEMKNNQHQMFKASGNCGMCKDRIETAAKNVKGVSSAVWDEKSKMVHVNFNPHETNLDQIQKAVALVGHDTEKYQANDEVYSKLPECCLYRN